MPPRSVTSCRNGQNVMPLPYGRQRPVATSATVPSSIRQLLREPRLPDPRRPSDCDDAPGDARVERAVDLPQQRLELFVRLTSGASSRRAYPDAAASTSSSRNRATDSRLPLAEKRSRGPTLTASLTSG